MNKENLLRLANLLEEWNESYIFDMRFYATNGDDLLNLTEVIQKNHCLTSCCALGHAANHKIGILLESGIIDWSEYSYKSFGLDTFNLAWDFIFSSKWGPQDTPKDCAKRIKHVVKLNRKVTLQDFIDYNAPFNPGDF